MYFLMACCMGNMSSYACCSFSTLPMNVFTMPSFSVTEPGNSTGVCVCVFVLDGAVISTEMTDEGLWILQIIILTFPPRLSSKELLF